MDQTRELLVLVIDLNMERITPNFVSGVKVVLINWRELMAERKCLSLSLYWRCVSGMNSLASTSRNVSRVLSGCLFHRSILSQYISSDLDSLNNVNNVSKYLINKSLFYEKKIPQGVEHEYGGVELGEQDGMQDGGRSDKLAVLG